MSSCEQSGNNSGNLGIPDPNGEGVVRPEQNLPPQTSKKEENTFSSPQERAAKRYRTLDSFGRTSFKKDEDFILSGDKQLKSEQDINQSQKKLGKDEAEPELPKDKENKKESRVSQPVNIESKAAVSIDSSESRPNKNTNQINIGTNLSIKNQSEIDSVAGTSAKDSMAVDLLSKHGIKVGDDIFINTSRQIKNSSLDITTPSENKKDTIVPDENNHLKKNSIQTEVENTDSFIKTNQKVEATEPLKGAKTTSEAELDVRTPLFTPKDTNSFEMDVKVVTKNESNIDIAEKNKEKLETNIASTKSTEKNNVDIADMPESNSKNLYEIESAPEGLIKSQQEIIQPLVNDSKNGPEIKSVTSTEKNIVEVDDAPAGSEKGLQEIDDAPVGNIKGLQQLDDAPAGDTKGLQQIDDSPVGSVKSLQEVNNAPIGDVKSLQEVDDAPVGDVKDLQQIDDAPPSTPKPENKDITVNTSSSINQASLSVSSSELLQKTNLMYTINTPASGIIIENDYNRNDVFRNKDKADDIGSGNYAGVVTQTNNNNINFLNGNGNINNSVRANKGSTVDYTETKSTRSTTATVGDNSFETTTPKKNSIESTNSVNSTESPSDQQNDRPDYYTNATSDRIIGFRTSEIENLKSNIFEAKSAIDMDSTISSNVRTNYTNTVSPRNVNVSVVDINTPASNQTLTPRKPTTAATSVVSNNSTPAKQLETRADYTNTVSPRNVNTNNTLNFSVTTNPKKNTSNSESIVNNDGANIPSDKRFDFYTNSTSDRIINNREPKTDGTTDEVIDFSSYTSDVATRRPAISNVSGNINRPFGQENTNLSYDSNVSIRTGKINNTSSASGGFTNQSFGVYNPIGFNSETDEHEVGEVQLTSIGAPGQLNSQVGYNTFSSPREKVVTSESNVFISRSDSIPIKSNGNATTVNASDSAKTVIIPAVAEVKNSSGVVTTPASNAVYSSRETLNESGDVIYLDQEYSNFDYSSIITSSSGKASSESDVDSSKDFRRISAPRPIFSKATSATNQEVNTSSIGANINYGDPHIRAALAEKYTESVVSGWETDGTYIKNAQAKIGETLNPPAGIPNRIQENTNFLYYTKDGSGNELGISALSKKAGKIADKNSIYKTKTGQLNVTGVGDLTDILSSTGFGENFGDNSYTLPDINSNLDKANESDWVGLSSSRDIKTGKGMIWGAVADTLTIGLGINDGLGSISNIVSSVTDLITSASKPFTGNEIGINDDYLNLLRRNAFTTVPSLIRNLTINDAIVGSSGSNLGQAISKFNNSTQTAEAAIYQPAYFIANRLREGESDTKIYETINASIHGSTGSGVNVLNAENSEKFDITNSFATTKSQWAPGQMPGLIDMIVSFGTAQPKPGSQRSPYNKDAIFSDVVSNNLGDMKNGLDSIATKLNISRWAAYTSVVSGFDDISEISSKYLPGSMTGYTKEDDAWYIYEKRPDKRAKSGNQKNIGIPESIINSKLEIEDLDATEGFKPTNISTFNNNYILLSNDASTGLSGNPVWGLNDTINHSDIFYTKSSDAKYSSGNFKLGTSSYTQNIIGGDPHDINPAEQGFGKTISDNRGSKNNYGGGKESFIRVNESDIILLAGDLGEKFNKATNFVGSQGNGSSFINDNLTIDTKTNIVIPRYAQARTGANYPNNGDFITTASQFNINTYRKTDGTSTPNFNINYLTPEGKNTGSKTNVIFSPSNSLFPTASILTLDTPASVVGGLVTKGERVNYEDHVPSTNTVNPFDITSGEEPSAGEFKTFTIGLDKNTLLSKHLEKNLLSDGQQNFIDSDIGIIRNGEETTIDRLKINGQEAAAKKEIAPKYWPDREIITYKNYDGKPSGEIDTVQYVAATIPFNAEIDDNNTRFDPFDLNNPNAKNKQLNFDERENISTITKSVFHTRLNNKWDVFFGDKNKPNPSKNDYGLGTIYVIADASKSADSSNVIYSIPIQSTPELTGESRSANWASHTALGRTNDYFIWASTASRTMQFRTTYAIIAPDEDSPEWFVDSPNGGTLGTPKTNPIYDAWGKHWTEKTISNILKLYRKLLVPQSYTVDTKRLDGNRLSPPVIAINFGDNTNSWFSDSKGTLARWIVSDLNIDTRIEAGFTSKKNPRMYDISLTLKEMPPSWRSYQTHAELGKA